MYVFCGGIDPYIVLQTKPIDSMKMMEDGERLSRIMQNNKVEQEKSRIYKDGGGDPEVMLELAKKSKLARLIVPYFQEQAYQQQQYELNRLKLQAEIEKAKQRKLNETELQNSEKAP